MSFDSRPVRHAYEAIAGDYAGRYGDELERSEFDRNVLEGAVARVRPASRVMDLGCGPAQIASYWRAHRPDPVVGIDVTPAMLQLARNGDASLPLVAGDALRLPFRGSTFGAVVAWYALHNLPRALLGQAFAEVRRVLEAAGAFVVATHAGEGEDVVESEHDGVVERVVITYYDPDELRSVASGTGFEIVHVRTRPPLPHEHQMTKVCLVAKVASMAPREGAC